MTENTTINNLSLDKQVCFALYSASRLVTQAYKPYLDTLEVTYPQYMVLLILWKEDGVSVNEITKALLLNTNTVSPLLRRMEKQGLINRERCKDDERKMRIALTKKAKDLEEKAKIIPDAMMQHLCAGQICAEDIHELRDTLKELVDVLSK